MTRTAVHFSTILFVGAVVLGLSVVAVVVIPQAMTSAMSPCTCSLVAGPARWLWAVTGVAGVVLARFVFVAIRTARRTRQFLVRTLHGSRKIAASKLGLTTQWPIDLIPDSAAIFCYGFFRPRLAIGERMLSLLDQEQLQAVVAHESAHASRRDPLRLFLVTIVADVLGRWLGGRMVLKAFTTHVECDADQAVVIRYGRTPLASAFLRLLDFVDVRQTVPIPFLSVTETRIVRLLGEEGRPRIRFAILTAVIIGVLGILGLRAAAHAMEGIPAVVSHGAMCSRPPVCAEPARNTVQCMNGNQSTLCLRRTVVEPLSRLP